MVSHHLSTLHGHRCLPRREVRVQLRCMAHRCLGHRCLGHRCLAHRCLAHRCLADRCMVSIKKQMHAQPTIAFHSIPPSPPRGFAPPMGCFMHVHAQVNMQHTFVILGNLCKLPSSLPPACVEPRSGSARFGPFLGMTGDDRRWHA